MVFVGVDVATAEKKNENCFHHFTFQTKESITFYHKGEQKGFIMQIFNSSVMHEYMHTYIQT